MSLGTENLTRSMPLVVVMIVGLLLTLPHKPAEAQQLPADAGQFDGVLILRNGNVLRGRIQRVQSHFQVAVEHGEVSVRVSDVEFSCRDLNQAYQHKRAALAPGDAQGHVFLAQWCQRNGLLGAASRELDDAAASQPSHPLIPLIRRRIEMAWNPPPLTTATLEPVSRGPSSEDLDRMIRGMPPGTVETFTQTVQPLLNNYCSGAACHGPGSDHGYRLARIPSGGLSSRRTTQRNLHATLQWIDRDDPSQSRLLKAPIAPHGPGGVTIFTNRRTAQYGQVVDWVYRVAQVPPPTSTIRDRQPVPGPLEATPAAVHATSIAPAAADLTGLTQQVPAWDHHPGDTPNLLPQLPPNPAPDGLPGTGAEISPGGLPNTSPNPLPNAPASKLRPAAPKRAAVPRPFVPADLFDPESFNRRFFKKSPPQAGVQ